MTLRRSLSTLSLVFILYFCTSGGAFTTETLVHAVGPGLALLMLLLVPLIFSLPEVLIVGELASMLPEEGGYYRWVRARLRPLLGLSERLAHVDVFARRHGDLPEAVRHLSRAGSCRG